MWLVVLFVALVAVPIALLLLTRRGSSGAAETDPRAHRDLGAHGGPSGPGSTAGQGPGGDYPAF